MQEFDFVIVGAGSAGCVLADRLSADGQNSVCVLEHGGSDRSVFIQMPSALSIPMHSPKYNWMYQTEPEPHLGGRQITCPRGKVLGGSSSINGLVYIRGNPADFDRWESEGAQGWSYADVLPYFRRSETRREGGDLWRGSTGKLATRAGELENPLYHVFVEAAKQAGYEATADINGQQQEGFGRMDMTVKDGVRWSAANAYLKPAMTRPNLTVITHALAGRIIFDGKRATGIAYRRRGSETEEVVQARREVILSGGPINSPQLLKLSGVGPAAELKDHGIDVVHDLPGVGENLQDHMEYYHQIACTQPITLYSAMGLIPRALIGLRWTLFKKGLGATNHFETCGFIRSHPDVPYPDIQYHFLPLAVTYDGKGLASEHGFQVHVGSMRSKSRGWVRLASRDPADHPKIRFNYMSHPDDWREFRACVRLTREIFKQPAFDPYRGRAMSPDDSIQTDAQIDEFIKAKVESAYHPSCTCKIGSATDPMAVVDAETRVHGLANLRVVDSSIMPSVTTGNLNAPTIMIGEKAADHILGNPILARSNAGYRQAGPRRAAVRG